MNPVVHTMDELRLSGNCLKGSRPLLSFDKAFDDLPQYQMMKELFIHVNKCGFVRFEQRRLCSVLLPLDFRNSQRPSQKQAVL
jgi:hypothetical protein